MRSQAQIELPAGAGFCKIMIPLPAAMLSSVVLAFVLLANVAASQDTNFTFNGFTGANLSLSGFAKITDGGLLQLTNDTQQAQGHAFLPLPLRFKDSTDGKPLPFSATFVFAIEPEHPDMSGHGIAFALCPSKEIPGTLPSQYLGLFNTSNSLGNPGNHIFAVELDAVKSEDFHDINNNHVGIDVNGLISVNSSPVAYFDAKERVWKNLTLVSGDPMQVWVDYSDEEMQLDVAVAPLQQSKPEIPLVSSKINLSSIVLDEMFVGFTASTGSATESHYILGWSFTLNGSAQPLNLAKLPQVPRKKRPKKEVDVLLLAVALPLAAVIVLLICAAIVFIILRRRKKFAEVLEDWEEQYGPQRFYYKDLYRATRGFNEENLLGVGGFGRVYKGVLPATRKEIAVKKISHDSQQGMREFISEIASMGRLKHRNLVQLLGYCRRQNELLLVYDYMPNGSLDRFLFDRRSQTTLGWSERLHVIKGVAAGLSYLHDGPEQIVIHRDIKAANVLLDDKFNGRLGDFGLARLYDQGTNPQTTRILGTLGYLAPELTRTGKATTQTDVYSFGAFLLEVASGRRPMEMDAAPGAPGLVEFVLECWRRGRILEARDMKLGEDFAAAEMEKVLKLGLLCAHSDPEVRPRMNQVVKFLDGDATLASISPNAVRSDSTPTSDEALDNFCVSFPSTLDAAPMHSPCDDFFITCPTTSEATAVEYSSPLFAGGR